MATQPTVTTYLAPILHHRLLEYQQEHSLPSLPHSIESVLNQFFGLSDSSAHKTSVQPPTPYPLPPSSNPTAPENFPDYWKRGMSTNALVARLNTNPGTLKKYLRELKQIQWAVKRDPIGLGWKYDPALERYYPVPVVINVAGKVLPEPFAPDEEILAAPLTPDEPPQLDQTSPEPNLEAAQPLELKGGLTQSQLSRLTQVPINTNSSNAGYR